VAFDEGNMLDCIEIDGASNNGVENVRDLIEKARFEPNQWKYKIYIIDEVHMLSTGAFNALLKTLEEPPDHVKFILATTEIDKVPETIRSRSLRFDFKKISETDIVKRLEYVCQQEGIKAEKEALDIIARAARGALRDALTLTEQNTVNQEISTEYVRSTLSLIEDSLIDEIIDTIVQHDREKMIAILDTLRTRHAEVRGLFDQIMYGLRDHMLESFGWKDTTSFTEYSSIFAVFESAYGRIRSIPDSWLLIEITLMRAVAREEISGLDSSPEKRRQGGISSSSGFAIPNSGLQIQRNEEKNNINSWSSPISSRWKEWTQRGLGEGTVWVRWKTEKWWAERTSFPDPNSFGTFSTKSTEEIVSEKKEQLLSEDDKTTEISQLPTPNSQLLFSYISFLEAVKQSKPALVGDLKTARFEVADTTLTLIFASAWHYGRINTPASKNTLSEILEGLYQTGWNIVCKLDATVGADIADEVF
jgi:DNA polymerase III gamma/tau subunit